ncbi:MAG TPA: rhomboid family intramembrane serine protease [Planctomycetota bacterium]|nr:rhomboid family intramembrane serine protease [Planctomycetota bacterium]
MAQPETTERTVCYRHPRVETAVSCAECGRPICPDCMVFGPVGIRCPECAGVPTGARRTVERVRTAGTRHLPPGFASYVLIALNIAVFAAEIATGSGWNTLSGDVYEKGALYGPLVGDGDWWRLITGAFLHAGLIHLLFNMLALWWFGRPLEVVVGSVRFVGVYLAGALAGSAGALLISPTTPTVGASGAIFAILGAGLVLERKRIYVFGGAALAFIVLNLVLTFTLSGISIGGHLGGLAGGVACMLLLSWVGYTHPLASRRGLESLAAILAVAVIAIAIAYARARGLA